MVGFIRKYLILLPIAFLVLNASFFQYASKKIESTMLQEKLIEVTNSIDVLAAGIESDTTRPWYENEQRIIGSIEFLDRQYQVYGAAFKFVDGDLSLITERFYEISDIDPMVYTEFVEAAHTHESGDFVVGYEPENQQYRELHIYFRWIPIHAFTDERFLVVGGVSKYSIVTQIPVWISIGQWVSMAVTFAFQIWMVYRLGRADGGNIGNKRRDRRG